MRMRMTRRAAYVWESAMHHNPEMTGHRNIDFIWWERMEGSLPYSNPKNPRASTFEKAVVGVGGAPSPMNERVRPCDRNVETRGVDELGNGTELFMLEVRVMAEGVRVVNVGEGGNTKSVWDGVAKPEGGFWLFGFNRELLRCRAGGGGFLDSVRVREGGRDICGFRDTRLSGVSAPSTTILMGEGGTGGRIPRGTGLRFGFVGRSNDGRIAVAGGMGKLNDVFHTGADGGGRAGRRGVVLV
jgi:hypothetical protein